MRVLLATLLLFTLTACGFEPVYRPQGAVNATLTEIQVAPIPGALGQKLTIALEDKLGSQGRGNRYLLTASVKKTQSPVIVDQDRGISRYQVIVTSSYSLLDTRTNKQIGRGQLSNRAAYNVVLSDYANYVAEQAAADQAVELMTESYMHRLLGHIEKNG